MMNSKYRKYNTKVQNKQTKYSNIRQQISIISFLNKMGQSNSTSPILPQSNQINFNYSRLLLKKDYLQLIQILSSNNSSSQHKPTSKNFKNSKNNEIINFKNNSSMSINNSITKYSLDKFEAVKVIQNQMVRQREERLKLNSYDEDDDDQYEKITTNTNVNDKNSSYLDVINNNHKNNNHNSNHNNNNNIISNKNFLQIGSNKKLQIRQSKRISIIPHSPSVAFARIQTLRIVYQNFIIVKKSILSKQKVKIINYFTQQLSMQNYMSNLIKIKQVLSSNSNNNGGKGQNIANNGIMSTSNHLPHINNNNSKNNSSSSKSSSPSILYEDFNIFSQNQLFIIEREFPPGVLLENPVKYQQLEQNFYLFMDLMCFLIKFYQKIDNLFIDPLNIIHEDDGKYYLLDFKYMKIDIYEILASMIEWIYGDWVNNNNSNNNNEKDKNRSNYVCTISNMSNASNHNTSKINSINIGSNRQLKSLQQYIQQKQFSKELVSLKLPIYIKQLYSSLISKQISRSQLSQYCCRIRSKLHSLSSNMDSFHACINYQKTILFSEDNHNWILGKKYNEIYFYNVEDEHCCQVKIIRKKKKVDLNTIKLIFDPEELQIKYIAENSKLILHAAQFQLEKHSSLSDIQIRYKLPIKFKSPFSFIDSKNTNIYILQSCVYRYHIPQNKLIQQTKKISQPIFLCKNNQHKFMIIRLSVDIFKNGIRVLVDNKEIDLQFILEKKIYEELANIRVDIKQVDFCKEIYKGVYIMLAHKNMWILDVNFNIFYSYATVNRIKTFYGFGKNPNDFQGEYAFEIFNQPFKVDFLTHQQGLNVKIKNNKLYIIGQISGNMYFFNYLFIPQAASLKLISYKPLIGSEDNTKNIKKNKNNQLISQKSINDLDQTQKRKKKVNFVELTNENKQNINISDEQALIQQRKLKTFEMLKNSFKKTITEWQKYTKQGYKKYVFNFHEQNLQNYKHQSWLYFDNSLLIIPLDFHLKSYKTNYEVQLLIPPTKSSLKQLIEQLHKNSRNEKSTKFKKQQILLYFNRLITIFQYITQNQLIHKNISIHHIYFDESNTLKLIGWSQPPRNWYVSDYKDLLLVFFNILTTNTLQKLNQKTLLKYQKEIRIFSQLLYEKMIYSFKASNAKIIQKKVQVEKQIQQIKDFVLNQLSMKFLETGMAKNQLIINENKHIIYNNNINNNNINPTQLLTSSITQKNQFIFNFQFNTHRLSMISIYKNKMKKIKCILDENSKQQLIFKSTDKHLWNQQKSKLYIFTTTYKFYQIKINITSYKQQTLICQQYQYIPNNILQSSFIHVPHWGIFSVGGIYKSKDSQIIFNKIIYKFNEEKLTWESIGNIEEPLMNPNLVLSIQGDEIYCLGGDVNLDNYMFKMILIKLKDKNHLNSPSGYQILSYVDSTYKNPLNNLLSNYPIKIYNLSKQLSIFMIFYINNQKYYIRIFSLTSFALDIILQTKNFSDQNKIISSNVGIQFNKGVLHVLRQYGKYTKVHVNKMDNLSLSHQTIYPERQDDNLAVQN